MKNFKISILTCLFAAFICVGAYISIPVPVSPVPITLQTFFIMLSALLLGPIWGPISVLIYYILGISGLPVFSGGGKGIAHFMGPTGGFLISFIIMAIIVGVLSYSEKNSLIKNIVILIIGTIIVYIIGILWLKFKLNISFQKAITIGFLPFIIGDSIKIIVASLIGWKIKPIIKNLQ